MDRPMLCYLAAGIGVFLWLRRLAAPTKAPEALPQPRGASPDLDGLPDVSVVPAASQASGADPLDSSGVIELPKPSEAVLNPFREAKRRPGSLDDILPPGDEQGGLDGDDGVEYDPEDQSV
jgi:hypothetical protein